MKGKGSGYLVIVLILGGGLWAAARGVSSVRRSIEQERQLQACITASELLIKYVKSNRCQKWPSSWDEFDNVSIESPIMSWPRDRAAIISRARIRFDVSIAELRSQDIDSFDGLRPTGDLTPLIRAYAIQPLLDAINTSEDSTTPPRP